MSYHTTGPGPGAYDIHTTIGAKPSEPMITHSGAFTFRRQHWRTLPTLPSSADYDTLPAVNNLAPRKPHHVFPTQARPSNDPKQPFSEVPGPGHYAPTKDNKAG